MGWLGSQPRLLAPESTLVTSGMMSCNFFFSPRRCHGFDFNFILIPEIKDISQAHALPQLEAGYLGNLVTKQNFTDQRSKELH